MHAEIRELRAECADLKSAAKAVPSRSVDLSTERVLRSELRDAALKFEAADVKRKAAGEDATYYQDEWYQERSLAAELRAELDCAHDSDEW